MKALSLSIVIPVYNEELQLKACLDSIAAQTVKPDEVIIVDNNSTDQSVAIARKYPFVRVVTEAEQGIVFARNRGFNEVQADIIGRIDADTILPPSWVQYVKEYYADSRNGRKALTGGGFFYNVALPRLNGWVQSQFVYRWNRFITGHYILWGSNMAFPRTAWEKVQEDICLDDDVHEDLDLAMHLVDHDYAIDYRASLRVGAKLKRVWENQDQMAHHLNRWPQSLRVHGYTMWWLGVAGNWFIWMMIWFLRPVLDGGEKVMRFIRWVADPIS